ncbi:MAG: hypothetical protein AAGA77_01115 [Bacteroidota bacterium]
MKKSILLFCGAALLLLNCNRKGSATIEQTISKDSPIEKTFAFPEDWLGDWSGELEIYDVTGPKQTVPMSLQISNTDTSGVYNWVLVYGKDSLADKRNYVLKEIDKSKGHYMIDEKNGILLDSYFINDELSSIFAVMGNTLVCSYRRKGQELIFSIKMYTSEKIRVSGDTLIAEQKIPEVKSYQHRINQEARLQKKCLVE